MNRLRLRPFKRLAALLLMSALSCTEEQLATEVLRFAPPVFDQVLVVESTAAGERVSIRNSAGDTLRSLEFEAPRVPVKDTGELRIPRGLKVLGQGAPRGRFDSLGAVLLLEHAGTPGKSFFVEYAAPVPGEFAAEYRFMVFTDGRRSYDSVFAEGAGSLVYNGFEFVACPEQRVCPMVASTEGTALNLANAGVPGAASIRAVLLAEDAFVELPVPQSRGSWAQTPLRIPAVCETETCLLWLRAEPTLVPPRNSLVPVRKGPDGLMGYVLRLQAESSGEKNE